MSTMGKDLGRGCGRAALIQLIAVAVGLPLGCILVGVPLWLIATFGGQAWVIAVSVGLYIVLVFGGGLGFMLVVVLRRKARLDAVFEPLGLSGGTYMTFFRQYHGELQSRRGELQGRRVDIYLRRGPFLEIEVDTPLQTRLGVTGPHADTRFLAGLAGREPLRTGDPALDALTVFSHDESWTRRLLEDSRAVELLQRLTRVAGDFTRQQVILRPGTFQLLLSGNRRLLGFELDAELVRAWLDDLLELAALAERLPAPEVTAELNSAEKLSGRLRRGNPYMALWVGLGSLVFFAALTVIVIAVVLVLSNMGAL